jgi:hypothetical protein
MATWSKLWELPKCEREAALLAARFTKPTPPSGGKAKNNPAQQGFKKP